MQRNELVVRANAVGIDPTTIPNDSKLAQKILYLEKRATTFSGTLATGTLTSDATAQSDGDQVTIGSVTYTFKTNFTGVKATGVLTATDVFSNGETVSVQGVTYTFRTTLSSPAQRNEVLIGVSVAVSLDNLKIAINASGGTEGTEYSVGTTAHPYVTATTNTNTQQTVAARNFGTEANSFSTVETCANASFAAALMSGGVANVVNEVALGSDAATMLDNLKAAINNSGTDGTEYSTGTKAHPEVTATTNTNTTQVVQAIDYSYTNASIATTDPVDTGSHMSWGATTLASGVAKVVALNSTTWSGSAGLSGDKNHQ